jgi:hypothetical protein
MGNQYNSLQLLVSQKDKELMTIKAAEYDKVDVIKQLADVDGKNKFMRQDNERLMNKVVEMEKMAVMHQTDIEKMKGKVANKDRQSQQLNQQHNQNLEQFDSKFDSMHRQL